MSQVQTVEQLEGLGGIIAFAPCPEPGFVLEGRVNALLKSVLDLDRKTVQIKADNTLSSVGKEEKIRAMKAEQDTIKAAHVQLREGFEQFVANLEASEKILTTPVPLATGDVVSRLDDSERREWFRGLPNGPERNKIIAEMGAGRHDELMQALARSPVPDDLRRIGFNAMLDESQASDPDGFKSLSLRRDSLAWVRTVTTAILRPVHYLFTTPGGALFYPLPPVPDSKAQPIG